MKRRSCFSWPGNLNFANARLSRGHYPGLPAGRGVSRFISDISRWRLCRVSKKDNEIINRNEFRRHSEFLCQCRVTRPVTNVSCYLCSPNFDSTTIKLTYFHTSRLDSSWGWCFRSDLESTSPKQDTAFTNSNPVCTLRTQFSSYFRT